MAGDDLNLAKLASQFSEPDAAAEYLEGIRWPDGVVCPKCGESEREPYRLMGQSRRLWKCRACRKQFTVTVGTIFESSHIPLNKWLLAFYLLCSSKKGMSAHQLHRSLDVTYKTVWFMFHRIRHAMEQDGSGGPLGGVVEVDETYVGGKGRAHQKGRSTAQKSPVVALVERGGRVRSFYAANVTSYVLKGAVRDHVEREARLMTDDFASYKGALKYVGSHDTIGHSRGVYARGDIHTNTVESYFATLKRGVNGTYHHISRAHLPRYLSEFDFRHNTRGLTDGCRTVTALAQSEGKRLTYRQTGQA